MYDVILADPPWSFEVWGEGGKGRSAEQHYSVMSLDDICALSVASITNDNCALFLWTLWTHIFDARTVIEAWGFTYRTLAWEWVKLNSGGMGLHMGRGYYTRSNVEPCLLAVRGSMPVAVRDELNVIMSPVRGHSRKPDEQYHKIERLYPDTRRLELFARQRWPGWDIWGNEVECDVVLEAGA